MTSFPPLEDVLTHRTYFGITTATNVQRAICRVLDGLPLGPLWEDEAVRRAFGGQEPPAVPPRELILLAGIRGGKSIISAACAIRASQIVDVSTLGPGDIPRIPLLATDKDAATIVMNHLQGHLLGRPALKKLHMETPDGSKARSVGGGLSAETVYLRHPSGRPIEIKVTALSRSGSTLVGRWLAGCVFDEAPRMQGQEDGVINLDHARHAILGRMLPGAQILYIGSPWAPLGPVYEMVEEHFGKPTDSICVIRARGPDMNPFYWTEERQRDLEKRKPATFRTDVLAEFADHEQSVFDSRLVEAATRTAPAVLDPDPKVSYVAAMDPATRGNAWTLVVLGCAGLGGPGGVRPRYSVALARQWLGSSREPLRPHAVLREIAGLVRPYGVDAIVTDRYSYDALREAADAHGVGLIENRFNPEQFVEAVTKIADEIAEGCLELPPDHTMRSDLVGTTKRPTANGVTIRLPRTGDGRHGDYVPALALCLAYPPEPPREPGPARDTMLDAAIARVESRGDWDGLAARLTR